MRIAIVVHGRFHAFDLAHSLIKHGHQVTVFTNYPKWAVEKFGIPKANVRSFLVHGLATRLGWRLRQAGLPLYPEAWLHIQFAEWASRQMSKEQWDVIHCWSSVAEESLNQLRGRARLRLMVRGSAHIKAQSRLLQEEEARTGVPQDQPSPWVIAREIREYALADRIAVLSTFALNSFLAEGVERERLSLLPLGANLAAFRPGIEVVEARQRRILSEQPLRVVYVGALTFQKGMWDLAAVVKKLGGKGFEFCFVGPQSPETQALIDDLKPLVKLIPKRPQTELPQVYAWGDIFIFPTIQDGFAVVLAQAAAAGLPILTTTNSAGPDLIQEGTTGWVMPIRDPEAFVARLEWCSQHRVELAKMVRTIPVQFQPRDWDDVAADFERICLESLRALDAKRGMT